MTKKPALQTAATEIPPWLQTMRTITGLTEEPGDEDNPKILAMRDAIAKAYPEMADYCDEYQHDDTPWCGLAAAYCMTMAGIRPPFGKTDTDRWMWALAWADDPAFGSVISSPRPGCVVVMEREGGGHVTFYESTSGSSYKCRGGNQSDAVNLSSYPIADVVALVWPLAAGPVPPAQRRTLERGDTGSDVSEVQRILGIPADGDFGAITEAAVEGFQAGWELDVDGVVGPETWESLDALDKIMKGSLQRLSDELRRSIMALAWKSELAQYNWADRGRMPEGYTVGMALSFAVAAIDLEEGVSYAEVMAAAEKGKPDTDALSWYRSEMDAMGWNNREAGADTLRHLWCLLIGLGPRESSGNHWCGRDQSASNTDAMTCEAGLFQTSWNINTASPDLGELFEDYWDNPQGFLDQFNEDVTPIASDLKNYGEGEGASYQWLAKYSPCFAAMTTAVGLRTRRQHWGPIGRKEVELIEEANDLLDQVQQLISEAPPPQPHPEPEVATVALQVVASGPVTVTVNGTPIGEL
jgi:uncharacterized protein (TIGR02594 family)